MKELTGFWSSSPLILFGHSQIANPGKWSFLLLLCTILLAPQASGRGQEASTRPLLPVAASSSLCRDFFPFSAQIFLFPLDYCSSSRLEVLSMARLSFLVIFFVWIQLETVESTVPQILRLLGFFLNPRFVSSISNRGLSSIELLFWFLYFFCFLF